jgi:hypothetical protein
VRSKEHLWNATQKESRKGASGRRLISSSRRARPHYRPNNHPIHTHTTNSTPATIHRPPNNNHRSDRTARNSNGGSCIEHFCSKHHASTPTPTPKYYGESDTKKFPMSYETAIASSRGDDTTLAKLFINSLRMHQPIGMRDYCQDPLHHGHSLRKSSWSTFKVSKQILARRKIFFRAHSMKKKHCQIFFTGSFVSKLKPWRSQMSKL